MCREKPCQPRHKKPIQIDMSYGNTFGTRKRFSLFILMNDFVKKKKSKEAYFLWPVALVSNFIINKIIRSSGTKNKLIFE